MIKSLGVLSKEQKQEIWKNKMSGSQVKRVKSDTRNLFLEKTGQKEIKDLGAIAKVAHYLDAGNYMEPVIIDMVRNLRDDLKDIKTTKETFVDANDDWYTANIDGYIGEDINNIDYIIEIKNTTEESNEGILAKYEGQVRYYSKIMDAKKGAFLIALVRGHDLRIIPLMRDEELETKMFDEIESFRQNVELGIEPELEEMSKIKLDDDAGDKISRKETFIELAKIKEEISGLKDREKELVDSLKSTYDEDFEIRLDGFKFTKSTTQRKGSIDNNKLIAHLACLAGVDYANVVELFRKPSIETTQLRVTEVK